MSRPRLRSPQQPFPLQLVLGLFEFLASLKLAFVVIASYVVVLAWGVAYIGATYGDPVVGFAVYNTWWFTLLNVLLAVNVLCAALIRIPWKRHQTGFVITHAGILTLLFGAYLSHAEGVDALLRVAEGHASARAQNDRQYLLLTQRKPSASSSDSRGDEAGPGTDGAGGAATEIQTVRIAFAGGPFNWEDYAGMPWLPWAFGRRNAGVLWDRDGVRLEAVDYYSDFRPVPQLKIRVAAGAERGAGAAAEGELFTLTVSDLLLGRQMPPGPYGYGDQAELDSGQRIAFWLTGDAAETAAFADAAPEGPLGPLGQVVLHAQGQKFTVRLDQLIKESEGHSLGQTGWKVTCSGFEPQLKALRLTLSGGGEPEEQMVLFATRPDCNRQGWRHQVFADFWTAAEPKGRGGARPAGKGPARDGQPGDDHDGQPGDNHDGQPADDADEGQAADALGSRPGSPRIDVIQGADRRLHARAWRAGKMVSLALLDAGGRPLPLWSDTPDALTLRVAAFAPAEKPDQRIAGMPFSRDKSPLEKHARVKVRLTVDGHSREFWLPAGIDAVVPPAPPRAGETVHPRGGETVAGQGRQVSVACVADVVDLGFGVYLHEFQRKLDPGTSEASHYASLVDLVALDPQTGQPGQQRLRQKVLISMNEPIDFSDPATGRSYRLYQESFDGPHKPGSREYEEIIRGQPFRPQAFNSILAVNYDPGRGWKYLGSLMIVCGALTLFYMKAYFFPGRGQAAKKRR